MNIKSLIRGEVTQNDLLNYHNATIEYINMPKSINGFVYYYKGIYDILINKNLSYYKKKKTILHELAHIELNQLCQANKDLFAFYIDKYEDVADKYLKEIMKEVIK